MLPGAALVRVLGHVVSVVEMNWVANVPAARIGSNITVSGMVVFAATEKVSLTLQMWLNAISGVMLINLK